MNTNNQKIKNEIPYPYCLVKKYFMSKEITETFSIEINGDSYKVTASNNGKHKLFKLTDNVSVDTKYLRTLGRFLIECSDKIDADPDFTKKQINNERFSNNR